MKILAIEKEKPGITTENFKPFLRKEAEHVWELYQKGIIRQIYFNQYKNAVLVIEENTLESAETILNEFPLVKNGLIEFEVMELKPYTGFSRLFN